MGLIIPTYRGADSRNTENGASSPENPAFVVPDLNFDEESNCCPYGHDYLPAVDDNASF